MPAGWSVRAVDDALDVHEPTSRRPVDSTGMGAATWQRRLADLARAVARSDRRSPGSTDPAAPTEPARPAYAGDFDGVPAVTYAPADDGDPDPGEVVWAWVPYEEDHTQGKDRPVLVVGRDGRFLLALAFTSKDHDRDAAQEARAGRIWFDVGSGDWDRSGRPSELRLDRVLRLDPGAVRREGAVLERARFDAMAEQLRRSGGR